MCYLPFCRWLNFQVLFDWIYVCRPQNLDPAYPAPQRFS